MQIIQFGQIFFVRRSEGYLHRKLGWTKSAGEWSSAFFANRIEAEVLGLLHLKHQSEDVVTRQVSVRRQEVIGTVANRWFFVYDSTHCWLRDDGHWGDAVGKGYLFASKIEAEVLALLTMPMVESAMRDL